MKERRRKIPIDTETEILIRSRRRCALCYGLKGDFNEKIGQIAHIDKNRTNDSLDNLAWLCFEHHSLYDSSTSQHKNYQPTEVKRYRDNLYAAIATSSISGPESIGRYIATQDTANVIKLSDRIIVIFDWPLRCTPTLNFHPDFLVIGKNIDIEQWSTRGFQLLLRTPIDARSFAFFADAAPTEYEIEANRQRDEWKAELSKEGDI